MGEEQELAVGEEIFFSGAPVALPPPGYGRLTELEAKRQRDWVLRWREGEDKRLANLQRERGGNEDLGAIGDGRSVWGPKPPANGDLTLPVSAHPREDVSSIHSYAPSADGDFADGSRGGLIASSAAHSSARAEFGGGPGGGATASSAQLSSAAEEEFLGGPRGGATASSAAVSSAVSASAGDEDPAGRMRGSSAAPTAPQAEPVPLAGEDVLAMVRSKVRDAVAHRDRELRERAAREAASRLREEGQREAIQEREDIIKQLELQRRVSEESNRQREEERIIREQAERNAELERERARAEEAEEEALRADAVRREIAKVDAAREEVSRRESAYRAAVQAEMSRAVASRGGEPVPVALSMWTEAEREWGPRAGVTMGSTTSSHPLPPSVPPVSSGSAATHAPSPPAGPLAGMGGGVAAFRPSAVGNGAYIEAPWAPAPSLPMVLPTPSAPYTYPPSRGGMGAPYLVPASFGGEPEKVVESDSIKGKKTGGTLGEGTRMEKPVVMPSKYDGQAHLAEYLAHFDLCRMANGWDDRTAGVFLGLSLTGVARRILSGIDPATSGFQKLRGALVGRFQPPNQASMYKAMLRSKERTKGECLQSHAEEVERYTRLAYPDADIATIDVMAKDRFIDSLKDQQLQCWIHQSQAKTLLDAVQVGLHTEACMCPHGQAQTVRATAQTMGENLETVSKEAQKERAENARFRETVISALAQQNSRPAGEHAGRSDRGERSNTGKWSGDRSSRPRVPLSETRCYHCAALGHQRGRCPSWLAAMAAADARTSAPAAPVVVSAQPAEN